MRTKTILVVGGAGFIGSHMVDYLLQSGYIPIVLDNLSTGHRNPILFNDINRENCDAAQSKRNQHTSALSAQSNDVALLDRLTTSCHSNSTAKLVVGDISDNKILDELFSTYSFSAVMHFASFIQVGESVNHPLKYYSNNVAATLNLLSAMLKWNVKHFIFSSTAAVYGEPLFTPIDETHPIAPINPYGHSKSMVEQVLADLSRAHDFSYMALRYFNAAGAHPEGKLKEKHEPETHLIPLILQTAQGLREAITVYGRDYPTFDGTCIRDYIHVTDLCSAHLLALKALDAGEPSRAYNLGTGQGYSVQQVIDVAREVTQIDFKVNDSNRRPGDPAILVANPTRAMKELQWQPKYSDLKTIVAHAWNTFKS